MVDVTKYQQKAEALKAKTASKEGTWMFTPRGKTQIVVLETEGVEADVYAEAISVLPNGKERTMAVLRVAVLATTAPDDSSLPTGWEDNIKALIIPPSMITPLMELLGQGYIPSTLTADGDLVALDPDSGISVFTIEKAGSGMDTTYTVLPVPAKVGDKLVNEAGQFNDFNDLVAEAEAYTANQRGTTEEAEAPNTPF